MNSIRPSLARILFVVMAGMLLPACKQAPSPESASPAAGADAPAATAEPNPAIARPEVAPPAAPSAPVIATQPGSKGSQWDLTKVAVTGNILTVQFNVRAGDEHLWDPSFPLSDISVVDDATAQRYSPLQDSSGKPMAAPLNSVNDKMLKLDIKKNSNGVIWVKFPAPPATSQTVSINVPEVAPFDGVTIQR